MSKPIAIGSDEAGFELKSTILELLHEKGLVVPKPAAYRSFHDGSRRRIIRELVAEAALIG